MQFILDCSVAISWCLVDEDNDYANAILAMMPDCEAFVPGIWSLEVANTLLVAERRNRMTTEQSEMAITFLQSLLIQVDEAFDSKFHILSCSIKLFKALRYLPLRFIKSSHLKPPKSSPQP